MQVVVVGLGPMGEAIARALGPRLVGAVEVRPDPPPVAAPVARTLGEVPGGAEVAVVATASRLDAVEPTVREALDAGLHVVATCEELVWPWRAHAERARAIDEAARARGRVVIATGVNPGLVMDRLVLTVARGCVRVERVEVERVLDLATRREALRRKMGVGLGEEEWRRRAAAGALGHVGLGESAALVAVGLGWRADDVAETVEPVARDGVACGARQEASAAGGRVRLRLEMIEGAARPRDEIRIEGDPPVHVELRGGLHGDRATVGAVLEAVDRAPALRPGLRSVLDLTVGPAGQDWRVSVGAPASRS